MKLIDLFNTCLNIDYETIGSEVNYAFREEENTLYIYFECSNGTQDWKANLDFKKTLYDGLFKVHRGFYDCYYQVRNIVLDKAYSKNWKEVVVVGYSHGGALCQFAVQDIKWHLPNLDVKGYAFESPRALKVQKELRFYWDGLTRIVNGSDLITHLPPKIFGFDDLGKVVKIKGDTKLVEKKFVPKCIKYHYPQCVADGLQKLEENGIK